MVPALRRWLDAVRSVLPLWLVGPVITLATAAALEFVARSGWHVPTVGAFMLATVVLAAFVGGGLSGLISGVLCLGYYFYYFRTHGPTWITSTGLIHTVELLLLAGSMVVAVGVLRRRLVVRESERAARAEAEAVARQYEGLVQGLDVVIWKAQVDPWRFTFVSERAEQMLGYPVADWLDGGLDFFAKLLHPDDREATLRQCDEATQRGEAHELEYRMVAADGRVVWVRDLVRVTLRPDGLPDTSYGVILDVTAARRAREAVRESEARLRAIFDTAVDGIVTIDERGVINSFNPAAEGIFGYKAQEVRGRNVSILMPEPHADAHGAYLRRFRATGEKRIIGGDREVIGRRKDGSTFPLELSVSETRLDDRRFFTGIVRDITDRKQVEAQLRNREQQLTALLNAMPDFVAFKDGEGRWLLANEYGLKLFGLEGVDYRGKRDSELAEHTPFFAEGLRACEVSDGQTWEAGQASRCEEVLPSRDGADRFYDVVKLPLYNEDGSRKGLLVVGRDVTDARKAQDALAREHAAAEHERNRLRAVLDILPVGVFLADAAGRLMEVNAAARAIWGDHELPERPESYDRYKAWRPGDEEPIAAEEWGMARALRRGETSVAEELEIQAFDGARKTILNYAVPIRDAQGRIAEGVAVSIDITQRKRAELRLAAWAKQQEAAARIGREALSGGELQALFDQTTRQIAETLGTEMCTVLELLPDETGLLVRAGVGWRDGVVGRAVVRAGPESQAGQTLLRGESVIIEDLAAAPFPGSPVLTEHGVVSGLTVIIPGRGGRVFGVLSAHTTQRRSFTRDDVNFLQVVANILAAAGYRKHAETQLKALNETLEQRVADRTAVAEHRAAQLRALASELTLAEERERRHLAQILHDHLQQLLAAAKFKTALLHPRVSDAEVDQALRQIDDLLDQSIDASRSLTIELSPPILYDAGLVAALEWLGRQQQEKYGFTVHVDADPDAEPAAEDVRVLLFQAVRELLFNVSKHAGIEEAWVTMTPTDAGCVRIEVRDAGRGFDPATLHGDRAAGGFGLFSIGERMDLIGGRMDIDSAPGQGTRITLEAPREQAPELTGDHGETLAIPIPAALHPPAHEPRPHPANVIRVLLADDHEILREGLAGLLREQPDIEVVAEASDGQMAVDLATRFRPDVVVMDLTMPRLNGIEATRRITSQLPDVHVIGLSIHEEEDMAAAMRDAGACAYLNKAGPSDALIAAIHDCVHAPSATTKG